jgi:hypothetical protein
VEQFAKAAEAVLAGLPGASMVVPDDVSGGASDPALVLLASSGDTLAALAGSLGVDIPQEG